MIVCEPYCTRQYTRSKHVDFWVPLHGRPVRSGYCPECKAYLWPRRKVWKNDSEAELMHRQEVDG